MLVNGQCGWMARKLHVPRCLPLRSFNRVLDTDPRSFGKSPGALGGYGSGVYLNYLAGSRIDFSRRLVYTLLAQ